MNTLLTNFLKFDFANFSALSIIFGITTYWIKRIIENKSLKQLELLKNELSLKQEIALQSFRQIAFENQIKYTKLTEKRFEKIEQLYIVLFDLNTLITNYPNIKSEKDILAYEKSFEIKNEEFKLIYKSIIPYINDEIENKLNSLSKSIQNFYLSILTNIGYTDTYGNPPIDLTIEEQKQLEVELKDSVNIVTHELKLIIGAEIN